MHNKVANWARAAALHASVPVSMLITHNHGDAHRLAERSIELNRMERG